MFPSRPARAGRSRAVPAHWGSFLSQAYVLALAEVARQGSRQHHISKTRGACGGHNSRTRLLATPAAPTPPPTAASAAPCEALPFSPGQAAQLATQVLQRIGPHRLALEQEPEIADRPDPHQALVPALSLEDDSGCAAPRVAADGTLGQLRSLDAGARHAEPVREVAQHAGDGAPARAHRPAAHAGLATVRRFLVDDQIKRLDLGHK